MGCRVLEQFDLIVSARDDPPFAHDHRANRHLLGFEGARRLPQCFSHEKMVALQIDDRIVRHNGEVNRYRHSTARLEYTKTTNDEARMTKEILMTESE